MEKELIEGEGPDRFRFDGYLISMRERAWEMNRF
jgi:hypothetical protein